MVWPFWLNVVAVLVDMPLRIRARHHAPEAITPVARGVAEEVGGQSDQAQAVVLEMRLVACRVGQANYIALSVMFIPRAGGTALAGGQVARRKPRRGSLLKTSLRC